MTPTNMVPPRSGTCATRSSHRTYDMARISDASASADHPLIGMRGRISRRHSARCPRSRARLLLDCSDSAQEYGHPEGEKVRAEVRGHGRVVMKSIDSAAILITY